MWCPVRALKYYWHRTKAKRSGDQLFIITKEPFSPASHRHHFQMDCRSYPGGRSNGSHVRSFTSRSRHQKCQYVVGPLSGVSVEEIHKAAYWRSPNSFISFYLRDFPAAEPSLSRAALAAKHLPVFVSLYHNLSHIYYANRRIFSITISHTLSSGAPVSDRCNIGGHRSEK